MGDYLSEMGGCLWWLITWVPMAILKIIGIAIVLFSGLGLAVLVGFGLEGWLHLSILSVVGGFLTAFVYYFTVVYLQEEHEFFSFLSIDD